MIAPVQDIFGRTFKTLRVSLTNTCNLACNYCVDPSEKNSSIAAPITSENGKVLSNEEYLVIINTLHRILHFETVRLTGGEPLLYKQIVPLAKGISKMGINNIKITSNGTLLESKAVELKNAGISSINISLDAVDSEISFNINKRKNLKKILNGIEKALITGMRVKVNCVVMRGINDTHIIKVFEYCKQKNIPVRFLELMEMGHLYHNFDEYFFSEKDIIKNITSHYNVIPLQRETSATAKYWTTEDGYLFGVISNVSSPFCNDCNRLRLDSYGNVYGCLSDNTPINILDCLDDDEKLLKKLSEALSQKQMKFSGSKLSMMHIGG